MEDKAARTVIVFLLGEMLVKKQLTLEKFEEFKNILNSDHK